MCFFRKNKRIKELEAENEALQKEIMFLKARKYLSDKKPLNVEAYRSIASFPLWINPVRAEDDIKLRLARELFPLMKIERDYATEKDKILLRASIRVVKE